MTKALMGYYLETDVHPTKVLVVKESAADLLVNLGIIGHFDLWFHSPAPTCYGKPGFLVGSDTKSHNMREPVLQGKSPVSQIFSPAP